MTSPDQTADRTRDVSKVERWKLAGYDAWVVGDDAGPFVRYSDYARLAEENETLRRDVERPEWSKVYQGVAHRPDRDDELVSVTRETLRLAASAIRASQEREAYHNFAAAEVEIAAVLQQEPRP